MSAPQGPYKVVSVNKAPERAKRLIGRIVKDVKDRYEIVHCANADTIDAVTPLVSEHQPDLLFCASMWTLEESTQIQAIAREIVPGLKTLALPHGLQLEKGPDAAVAYVVERIDELLCGRL